MKDGGAGTHHAGDALDGAIDITGIESPMTVRRQRARAWRQSKMLVRGESARKALGVLESGMELFGFTKGQFSFVDLLHAVLQQTGPADVAIATWSAAGADVEQARGMLESGSIRSLRFLVDVSFQVRQPEFCAELRRAFDDDAIRVTVFHAKFLLVRNERWNLAIRTSMNLNYNPRFENFEISDDATLADFLAAILDEIWSIQQPGDAWSKSVGELKSEWGRLFGTATVAGELVDSSDLVGG